MSSQTWLTQEAADRLRAELENLEGPGHLLLICFALFDHTTECLNAGFIKFPIINDRIFSLL